MARLDKNVPLRKRARAYLDTETTGLDPSKHEVIEVAIVFDKNGLDLEDLDRLALSGIHLSREADYLYWHTRIKPEHLDVAEQRALEVNGYAKHPELWNGAPTFREVMPVLSALLKDAIIVGQNVKFDTQMIEGNFRRNGEDFRLGRHQIDVVGYAYERLVPLGMNSLRLDDICPVLGISNDGNHTALVDARRARLAHRRMTAASAWLMRLVWRYRIWRSAEKRS